MEVQDRCEPREQIVPLGRGQRGGPDAPGTGGRGHESGHDHQDSAEKASARHRLEGSLRLWNQASPSF